MFRNSSENHSEKKSVFVKTIFKNYKHESIALMSATEFHKRLNDYFGAGHIQTLKGISDYYNWNPTALGRKLKSYHIEGKEIFTSTGKSKLQQAVEKEQAREKTIAKEPVNKSSIHAILNSNANEISQTSTSTEPLAESNANSKKRQREDVIENINWVFTHPHKKQYVLFQNDNSYPQPENKDTFTPLNKK